MREQNEKYLKDDSSLKKQRGSTMSTVYMMTTYFIETWPAPKLSIILTKEREAADYYTHCFKYCKIGNIVDDPQHSKCSSYAVSECIFLQLKEAECV